MRHIMVMNAKGGCGKSTLATNIAAYFANEGFAVALADYAGDAPIAIVEYFEEPTWEYRRSGPAWRVSFDDGEGTRLYVSEATGQVTARRNDVWRVFDFFWMLHIMDYKEREDFNHPLLISFSALALISVLAGLVLLIIRMRRFVLVQLNMRRE